MKKILLVLAVTGLLGMAGCEALTEISKSAEDILNNGGTVSQTEIVAGLKRPSRWALPTVPMWCRKRMAISKIRKSKFRSRRK